MILLTYQFYYIFALLIPLRGCLCRVTRVKNSESSVAVQVFPPEVTHQALPIKQTQEIILLRAIPTLKGSIGRKSNKVGMLKQTNFGPIWHLEPSRWLQHTPIWCGNHLSTSRTIFAKCVFDEICSDCLFD